MAVDSIEQPIVRTTPRLLLFEPAEPLAYSDGGSVQTDEGSLDLERALTWPAKMVNITEKIKESVV